MTTIQLTADQIAAIKAVAAAFSHLQLDAEILSFLENSFGARTVSEIAECLQRYRRDVSFMMTDLWEAGKVAREVRPGTKCYEYKLAAKRVARVVPIAPVAPVEKLHVYPTEDDMALGRQLVAEGYKSVSRKYRLVVKVNAPAFEDVASSFPEWLTPLMQANYESAIRQLYRVGIDGAPRNEIALTKEQYAAFRSVGGESAP